MKRKATIYYDSIGRDWLIRCDPSSPDASDGGEFALGHDDPEEFDETLRDTAETLFSGAFGQREEFDITIRR